MAVPAKQHVVQPGDLRRLHADRPDHGCCCPGRRCDRRAKTMSGLIPVVVLQGPPFERGLQHGARFRAEIVHVLAALKAEKGAGYLEARRRAGEAWPTIAAAAPSVAGEMDGMAEGAGVERLDM